MEEKVLLLNLSDSKDSEFEGRVQDFLKKSGKSFSSVSLFSDFKATVFIKERILKIILYFDMTDISEEELSLRLIQLNQSYAPFHDLVYVRDNDIGPAKTILSQNFLYRHLYPENELLAHLEEVFEEEGMIEMAESELYPIWQDILNGIYTVDPKKIEDISSDLNSVFIRGILYMKKGNRQTAFEILKNLFLTHQKYFPVIEILKEFEDMKDGLPMEFYLNYKLFNKIKQSKVNYLKAEEKKKRKRSKFDGLPNEDKTLRKSQYKGLANVDKSLKKFKLNYKDFEDLKRKLAAVKKLDLDEMRDLNETANRLSREGKHREAVEIYKKIYKNVERSKKYKILLNIAIAYKRVEDWKLCHHYAQATLKHDRKNAKALELLQQCKEKNLASA